VRRPRPRRLSSGRRAWRGWSFVLALLIVVSVAAGVPYFVAGEDARRPPQEPLLTRLDLPPGRTLAGLQAAQVEEVIDGDTIDVTLGGKRLRVRYYGVDTPERGDRCFREATDRNETLIGKTVLLLPDARDEDAFGRSLRYVFTTDGVSVDATLVAEGFGRAWREDGRYRQEIIGLEAAAAAAGRGCLWK
jgi:endonuclease YncB( thermonuclease family)